MKNLFLVYSFTALLFLNCRERSKINYSSVLNQDKEENIFIDIPIGRNGIDKKAISSFDTIAINEKKTNLFLEDFKKGLQGILSLVDKSVYNKKAEKNKNLFLDDLKKADELTTIIITKLNLIQKMPIPSSVESSKNIIFIKPCDFTEIEIQFNLVFKMLNEALIKLNDKKSGLDIIKNIQIKIDQKDQYSDFFSNEMEIGDFLNISFINFRDPMRKIFLI